MKLELRSARLEGVRDGKVAAHGQRLRAAHAQQLVGRFDGAAEIEVIQEPRIVDRGLRGRSAAAREALRRRTNRHPAGATAGQLARLGVAAGDADVEMLRPIALRIARWLVPIVIDLLVDEHRPLARH